MKNLNKLSSLFILISAVSLGFEAAFHSKIELLAIFRFIDIVLLTFFTIEFYFRFKYKQFSFVEFKSLFFTKNAVSEKSIDKSSVLDEWGWLFFDLSILVLTFISYFEHFIEHPQMVLLFRLFRVFRIFRVFELSSSLKSIEKKILSTFTTILTFLFLLLLILYSYAIVGMYLYNFQNTASLDFSSIYSTMTGLFLLMTNDWAHTLNELRSIQSVPPIYTDVYLFSFFIFSVIITLNVFLAVMTSQIQDKLKEEIKGLHKKEEEIAVAIRKIDAENDSDISALSKKMDQILEKLNNTK